MGTTSELRVLYLSDENLKRGYIGEKSRFSGSRELNNTVGGFVIQRSESE